MIGTCAKTAWCGPTLDHVRDCEACQIQQALDVEVVSCLQCTTTSQVSALKIGINTSVGSAQCSALHEH